MFIMYDSTDLSQVPKEPHAVACYRNGKYANEQEARRRFPHARILTIAVGGLIVADCYDIERGDYRPDQAAELWYYAHSRGVWRPCFYASESDWGAVHQNLVDARNPSITYRKWQAHYTGVERLPTGYDACQFTDRALGRNLDESICADNFFPPAPHPAEHWDSAEVQYNPTSHEWRIAPMRLDAPPLR